jgi:hypothetical protein
VIVTLGRYWIGAAHFGAGFFGREHPFDAGASTEVDHHFQLGRLLHRQFARFLAVEDAAGIDADLTTRYPRR